ncbi:hypothetical protein BKK80_34650 (plasmid) [Cupriavidus malaysiensis]|uniref:Uncharacterized protein n=1 Tax=Cupriavidus malaysiensis TaxID=367825 RepID=A0ABM6FGR7_9BURK|nr:hypothetical protein BKK80_34650 [Cupriavidus malaysiensis]
MYWVARCMGFLLGFSAYFWALRCLRKMDGYASKLDELLMAYEPLDTQAYRTLQEKTDHSRSLRTEFVLD